MTLNGGFKTRNWLLNFVLQSVLMLHISRIETDGRPQTELNLFPSKARHMQ